MNKKQVITLEYYKIIPNYLNITVQYLIIPCMDKFSESLSYPQTKEYGIDILCVKVIGRIM
jgi:hypothetical protein